MTEKQILSDMLNDIDKRLRKGEISCRRAKEEFKFISRANRLSLNDKEQEIINRIKYGAYEPENSELNKSPASACHLLEYGQNLSKKLFEFEVELGYLKLRIEKMEKEDNLTFHDKMAYSELIGKREQVKMQINYIRMSMADTKDDILGLNYGQIEGVLGYGK